jgi:hypothetical protein
VFTQHLAQNNIQYNVFFSIESFFSSECWWMTYVSSVHLHMHRLNTQCSPHFRVFTKHLAQNNIQYNVFFLSRASFLPSVGGIEHTVQHTCANHPAMTLYQVFAWCQSVFLTEHSHNWAKSFTNRQQANCTKWLIVYRVLGSKHSVQNIC